MSFDTYSALQVEVTTLINRTDMATLVPSWIKLCEADMQRRLKVADQELSTTLTATSGQAALALPASFVKPRRLRLIQSGGYVDLWPVSLAPSLDDGVNTGITRAVSLQGSNFILSPKPSSALQFALDYYAKFTPLSDAATSNWILANHPDAYLYGTALHSAPKLGNDNRLPMWDRFYSNAIKGIKRADFEKRSSELQRSTELAGLTNRRFNINTGQ